MIITVGNQKGGVGKTTLATNLAVLSVLSGSKTLLIDADTQGSSMDFRSFRGEALAPIQAVSITKPILHQEIHTFTNFDNIFIDAGGRDSETFRSGIVACDLFLVPITPSPYDVWASEETFKKLREARIYKPIDVLVVINQVIANTTLSKEVSALLEDMAKEYELRIAKTVLVTRQDFKRSAAEGKGVSEFAPNSKADQEIRNLYEEVLQCQSKERNKKLSLT